jgi:hypothetical protein
MIHDYQVGMRVCMRDDRLCKGTVIEHYSRSEVQVRWDSDVTEWIEGQFILPDNQEAWHADEENAAQVQAKINEATRSLEAAFKALREANKLETGMENAGPFYGLSKDHLDMTGFEEVLIQNGWESSSLYC